MLPLESSLHLVDVNYDLNTRRIRVATVSRNRIQHVTRLTSDGHHLTNLDH